MNNDERVAAKRKLPEGGSSARCNKMKPDRRWPVRAQGGKPESVLAVRYARTPHGA